MNCGITGHRGALGQEFIKYNKKINFIKFQGDLTKKNKLKNGYKKIVSMFLFILQQSCQQNLLKNFT